MTKSKQGRIPAKALPRSGKSEKTKSGSVNINLTTTKKIKLPAQAKITPSKRGIIVKNYEFASRITCAETNVSKLYLAMNPGDSRVFPWLSVIAKGYEKFKIHKLKAHYVHTCPATTLGQYAMYFDYDARDLKVDSMQIALQNFDRVDAAVYVDKTLNYRKSVEALKSYYIYKDTSPQAQWAVDEVPAKLNVITADGVANAFVGNLFFEYEIELEVPEMFPASSTTSLCLTPTADKTAVSSTVVDAIKDLIPIAVPGSNYSQLGLSLQMIPSMSSLSTLGQYAVGMVTGNYDGHAFSEINSVLQNIGTGYPVQSLESVINWLNSGSLARSLTTNIVVPPESSVFIDLLSTFDLDSEDPIMPDSIVPFTISNVLSSGYAYVANSWSSLAYDAGGASWMWRYQAILTNPTGTANAVIAGLRPATGSVLGGLLAENFSSSIMAALTPFILDYVNNAVQGSKEFSRPAKNLLAIGGVSSVHRNRKSLSNMMDTSDDHRRMFENPKPQLLKTPENFRDYTSKITWQR